jgi:hypothetical protein
MHMGVEVSLQAFLTSALKIRVSDSILIRFTPGNDPAIHLPTQRLRFVLQNTVLVF